MRQIKFRAWDMVIGKIIGWEDLLKKHNLNEIFKYGYDLELMQYTGFKDKNGTEIYEGDIIKSIGYVKPYLQDIKYNEKLGGYYINFCYTENIEYVRLGEKTKFIKVIGNIHDNPELLEKGA
ncbi:MAG: YopX family protein [Bacilli bacterium]|nr:YopX family protein [Bacilli bacterium]